MIRVEDVRELMTSVGRQEEFEKIKTDIGAPLLNFPVQL